MKEQPGLVTTVAAAELASRRQLDRWVGELRALVVGGQVELMARVGEYLIEQVYGSVEEALSRRSGKHASVRRLGERAEEFGMSASGLARAVPMALQVRQLGRPLALRLGVEHHRALLPVKDPGEKRLLAEAALGARWTVADLRKKVRRVKRPQPGGRRREPEVRVLVRRLDRLLAGATTARGAEAAAELGAVEARRLLGTVNRAQATLERIEKLLTRTLTRPG